jgi:hypothetical protein
MKLYKYEAFCFVEKPELAEILLGFPLIFSYQDKDNFKSFICWIINLKEDSKIDPDFYIEVFNQAQEIKNKLQSEENYII